MIKASSNISIKLTVSAVFTFSLFGLCVGSGSVFMGLIFKAVLPLVPIKQSLQDGGQAVLSQRAHGADQLHRRRLEEQVEYRLTLFVT